MGSNLILLLNLTKMEIEKIFKQVTGIATDPDQKEDLINIGYLNAIDHISFIIEFMKRWVVYIDQMLMKHEKGTKEHAEIFNSRGFTYQEFCLMLDGSIDEKNYHRYPIFQLMYIDDAIAREEQRITGEDDELSKPSRYQKAITDWIKKHNPKLELALMKTKIPIYLDLKSFKKSVHLLSSSGFGKSTLLKTVVHEIQRISLKKRNISTVVIDPHSEMAVDLLRMKWNKIDKGRLVFLDTNLRQTAKTICGYDVIGVDVGFSINPFDATGLTPFKQSSLANEIARTIFSSIPTDDSLQMITVLENLTEFLLARPDSDMLDLLNLAGKGGMEFYKQDTKRMKNHVRRSFMEDVYEADNRLASTKSSIQMRLLSILANLNVRQFLTGPRSVDVEKLINSGHTVICNFKGADVGEDGASLMTKIFFGILVSATLNRVTLPKQERIDTYLIADEFSKYYSDSVTTIIDQTRKFGLGSILSHQRVSQIRSENIEKALGATSIKIAGPSDNDSISFMAGEMNHITASDISGLDNFSFYYQDKMNKKAGTFKFRSAPFLADENSEHYMNKSELAKMFKWIAFESGYYRVVDNKIEGNQIAYTHKFTEA